MTIYTPFSLTEALVKIPSANPFLSYKTDSGSYAGISCENEVNIFLEAVLIELGFMVERQIVEKERHVLVDGKKIDVPERFNLLAEKGDGEEAILFFAHTDTVDVKRGWSSDPFSLSRRSGEPEWKYFALGANDMKGAIAAMILGLAEAEIPAGLKIKIAILADEEYWSFGAETMIASGYLEDVRSAFVPEISDEIYPPGEIWVGVGRRGRSEFEVEVFGKSCHGADSSKENLSVNAVHEASHLIFYLNEYLFRENQKYHDGDLSIEGGQYISAIKGGRAILSVPEYCRFTIDKAFIPTENEGEFVASIFKFIELLKVEGKLNREAEIKIEERERPTPTCKSYANKLDSSFIKKVEKILGNLGVKPNYGIGLSVADENRIANLGIPTMILGPSGAGSHTCDEWVDVRSLDKLCEVYKNIVEKW